MAKKKRGKRDGDRMESLADLTPENVKKSGAGRSSRMKPVSADEQSAWDERVAQAKAAKAGRQTAAPLIVAGIAVLAVVGVVTWSALSSGGPVTVGTMPTPVIAADDAGSAVYPANSAEAVRENVRFGFIPAVDLVELSDGTVVLGAGGPDAGEDVYGATYADLTLEEFEEAVIPAPREDTEGGTPVTWSETYGEFAEDTVFMPAVDSDLELEAVLSAAKDADRLDALIVRTSDADHAAAVNAAGAVSLFNGDVEKATPDQLAGAGFEMVAMSAENRQLDEWLDSGVAVWATDVATAAQADELVEAGVRGVLAVDPYAVQNIENSA